MTREEFDQLKLGDRVHSPLGNVYTVSHVAGVGRYRTVRLTGPDFLTADARMLAGSKWVKLPATDELSEWPTNDFPDLVPGGKQQ